MRLVRAFPLIALAALAAALPAQETKEKGDKPKKDKSQPVDSAAIAAAKRRSERLFGSDEVLEFRLAADYKAAFRSRDTLKVSRTTATLTVNDSSGQPTDIAMHIEPRGNFRLRSSVCNFPPIKLVFPDSGLKGTPFAGQKSLKLGTHCQQNDKEYAEYVLREYAVYEAFNLLTDVSFKARLARVTYVPLGNEKDSVTKYAFLIEDDDDVAKRNGARIATLRGGSFDDMERDPMALIGVFHYFTGNTDWSVWSLHNIRLLVYTDGRNVPVPYDFDWSGVVWARYAKPDFRLGIKTVQDRLYRGPCITQAELTPIVAKFNEQREAIKAIYTRLPLSDGYRRKALDYYDEFYRIINDPRQAKREIIEACAGRAGAFGIPAPSTPLGARARSLGQ